MSKLTFTSVALLTALSRFSTASLAGPPSQEALDFVYRGINPRSPESTRPRTFADADRILAPSGSAELLCVFIPKTMPQSLLCEYAGRAARTIGRENSELCGNFTDAVTNLGEGGQPRPPNGVTPAERSSQVVQVCRTAVGRLQALERKVRSGQMPKEGVADAAGVVHSGFSAQVRAWRRVYFRARAQCRTDHERASLDQAFNALEVCVRDIFRAFSAIANIR